jgi:hypothetical protein
MRLASPSPMRCAYSEGFERYNIVSDDDLREAALKLRQPRSREMRAKECLHSEALAPFQQPAFAKATAGTPSR